MSASKHAHRSNSRLGPFLRLVAYALLGFLAAWPFAVPEGAVAASACALIGAAAGRTLGRSKLRTIVLVVGTALGVVIALQGYNLLDNTGLAARWVGPALAHTISDVVLFGLLAAVLSAGSCAISYRYRWFSFVEVGVAALAFSHLLVSHRHGAINRPFEIADPILAAGGDPALLFFGVGCAAVAIAVLLLLREGSAVRSVIHLATLAAVVLLIVGQMRSPAPPAHDAGLGLREGGDPRDGKAENHQPAPSRQEEGLQFRNDYNSVANQAPVGVVILHNDYSPPSGVYYFRQAAFSQFNGRRLVSATTSSLDRDVADGFPTGVTALEGAPQPGSLRSTVHTTVALLAEHARPFALAAPVRLEKIANPNPGRFRRVYKAESLALSSDFVGLFQQEAGDEDWDETVWSHYTAIPDDPRYQHLSEKILGDALPNGAVRQDPMMRALAITGWLSAHGTYSLRSRHANSADPTADFLFGDVTGYCVHFAHAAAYLLRSAGLPARVATGYAVDESARQGGSAILITGQTAHAWPEIYLRGAGWIVVDVVPETIVDPPPPPPDPDLQRLLAEMVRGEQPLVDETAALPALGRAATRLGQWLRPAAIVVCLSTLLILFSIKFWRRWVPWLAHPNSQHRVAYRAALDRLSELAIARDHGECRERFARRVSPLVPSFTALTRDHVAAAFGGKRDGTRMRQLLTEFGRELGRATPRWRRILGVLIPWSWLHSR